MVHASVCRSPLNLVDITTDLRRRAEQYEPAFSTRQLVEACFPDVLVTGGILPPGVDEAVKRTPTGPIIIYARSLPGPAQRFAICHALAHLLFDGHRESCRIGHAGDLLAEHRADEFAAELLSPLQALAEYVGRHPSLDPIEHDLYLDQVDEIASHFMVPSYVIDQRIRLLILS